MTFAFSPILVQTPTKSKSHAQDLIGKKTIEINSDGYVFSASPTTYINGLVSQKIIHTVAILFGCVRNTEQIHALLRITAELMTQDKLVDTSVSKTRNGIYSLILSAMTSTNACEHMQASGIEVILNALVDQNTKYIGMFLNKFLLSQAFIEHVLWNEQLLLAFFGQLERHFLSIGVLTTLFDVNRFLLMLLGIEHQLMCSQ